MVVVVRRGRRAAGGSAKMLVRERDWCCSGLREKCCSRSRELCDLGAGGVVVGEGVASLSWDTRFMYLSL